MVIDLYDLAGDASGGIKPPFGKYTAALLMPLMVVLGGIYLFPPNNCNIVLKVFGIAGACAIFGVVLWGILEPVLSNACRIGVNATDITGYCPIIEGNLKTDKDAVLILTFLWIGYPMVGILSLIARDWPSVETGKDFLYAVLDVTSKGGLAMFVAFRSTWL